MRPPSAARAGIRRSGSLELFRRDGQRAGKGRAAARSVLDPDLPAHDGEQPLADGEAEPGSEAGAAPLETVEGIEQELPDVGRHPGAVVDDPGDHLVAGPTDVDLDRVRAGLRRGG